MQIYISDCKRGVDKYFFEIGGTIHAHQAKILRHSHNENFTFLQLFMRIQLIFFVFGNNQFLKLIALGRDPLYKKYSIE